MTQRINTAKNVLQKALKMSLQTPAIQEGCEQGHPTRQTKTQIKNTV